MAVKQTNHHERGKIPTLEKKATSFEILEEILKTHSPRKRLLTKLYIFGTLKM